MEEDFTNWWVEDFVNWLEEDVVGYWTNDIPTAFEFMYEYFGLKLMGETLFIYLTFW